MKSRLLKLKLSFYVLSLATLLASSAPAQDGPLTEDESAAPARATASDPDAIRSALQRAISGIAEEERFLLQYKLQPGKELLWNCEQSASTRTRMGGQSETSTARTKWKTAWQVDKIDGAGNMVFTSCIQQFSMWQQIDDKPPTSIDSSSAGRKIPDEFSSIADKLQPKPSRFSITPSGTVVRSEASTAAKVIGYSDITIPLPEEAVPCGHHWHVNRQLPAREADKSSIRVAIRTHYELTKVVDRKAYISFRTEPLTPALSAAVRSQIMQNMTRGYIVFDLELGLPVYRETDWDEKVQAFSGPDSYLMYVAKTVEKLEPLAEKAVTVQPASNVPASTPLTPLVPRSPADPLAGDGAPKASPESPNSR